MKKITIIKKNTEKLVMKNSPPKSTRLTERQIFSKCKLCHNVENFRVIFQFDSTSSLRVNRISSKSMG